MSFSHGIYAGPCQTHTKYWLARFIFACVATAFFTLIFGQDLARSQEPTTTQPLLNLGDAVVTGLSGVLEIDAGEGQVPEGKERVQLFIDPDGASLRGFDLSNPGVVGPLGQPLVPEFLSITAREIGQVFGVALDDATDPATGEPAPNIYVTATSAYGLPIVAPDANGDGAPERLTSGAADAEWMEGLFGLAKGGGPGSVWKIDGNTGEVTLFTEITRDGQPNSGAALGNIAFDVQNRQLFVSDRDTGLIHRIDLSGAALDIFDHGVAGRGTKGLDIVPFDEGNRADMTVKDFKPADPDTWGFAEPRRRVWGLAVHDGRLYYSIADGPQIWSIGLNADGGFDISTTRREIDLSGEAGPREITDIVFTQPGKMLLAQRQPVTGAADFRELVAVKGARVLRYGREPTDGPGVIGSWAPEPGKYAVGDAGEQRSAAGGIALGYGYGQAGKIDQNSCSAMVWATGDALGENPLKIAGLQEEAQAGLVDGIQGLKIDQLRAASGPPAAADFVIDYDGQYPEVRQSGHVGDIEIAHRCPDGALAEAPGPPVLVGPGTPLPAGPSVAPGAPAPQFADLAIDKRIVGTCAKGLDCQFELVVTNLGPASYRGPLVISDTVSVPNVTMTGAHGGAWNCQQAGNRISCNRPTLLLRAGRSTTLPLRLVYTGNPNIGSWQNCAMFTWLGQGPANVDTVRAVQAELTRLGYYNSPVDGVAGSGTRKAIRALEQALGLPQSGKITPTLLEWMFGLGASVSTDLNPGNDIACVTVPTQLPPPPGGPPLPPANNADLAVEKGPSHPAITILNCSVDALCKFRVTITNKGPQPYTGPIIIKDKLLPGFKLASWNGPSFCQQQGTVFSCGLVPQTTVAFNQSLKWDFELKLPSSAPSSAKHIQNCAELDWKSGPGDTDKTNDRGCATIVVAPGPPELQIKKSGPKQCYRGKDCSYQITVTNKGKTPHLGPISIEDRNFKGTPGIRLSSYGPKPPWKCVETSLGKYFCDHPAKTLKPGDSLPVLTLKVHIPKALPDKIDVLTNYAAITQGQGKIGKEARLDVPIKPVWDLRPRKSGPKICYPEANGRCRYSIDVWNAGKATYEGPVTVIEDNKIKTITLDFFGKLPWSCKDGPAPGNIICTHPYVVLKPNQHLPGLTITVDLHQKVPPQIKAITDCAKVFYKGGQDDADPTNDHDCITTPLHRGGVTVTGVISPNVVLGILFPVNCIVTDIAVGPGNAGHLGCTDYEFTVTNEGKAAYERPMTLRVGIPPGSKFAKAHGNVSAPQCRAGGWSCSVAGDEIICRPSDCKLAPGAQVSVLTDITLLGGGRVDIPPEGLPKTVCGELEWFADRDPSGIEQQGERRISRACGTTLILLEKKSEAPDMEVVTHPQRECAIGQTCLVGTEVINVGRDRFTGRIELQGQVNPPLSIRAVKAVQRGWNCRTTGGGRYNCRINRADFAPKASAQFQLALAIPRNFRHEEITHVVRLVWPRGKGDVNPENDEAAVTMPIGEREAPRPLPPALPECTGGKVPVGQRCVCPEGTNEIRGICVPAKVAPPPPSPAAPPSCTGGKVPVGNRCVCPPGTHKVRGRCIWPKAAPPPPPPCTGGNIRIGNRCVCPRGTNEIRGMCVPIKVAPPPPPPCTGGKIRIGNRCVCPRGTQELRGLCVRPQPVPKTPPPPPPPPKAPPVLKMIPSLQPPPTLKMIPICPQGQKWVGNRCLPIVQ